MVFGFPSQFLFSPSTVPWALPPSEMVSSSLPSLFAFVRLCFSLSPSVIMQFSWDFNRDTDAHKYSAATFDQKRELVVLAGGCRRAAGAREAPASFTERLEYRKRSWGGEAGLLIWDKLMLKCLKDTEIVISWRPLDRRAWSLGDKSGLDKDICKLSVGRRQRAKCEESKEWRAENQ